MIRNVISVVSWNKSYKLINMFSTSPSNIVTENGDTFIPASQRPDGTWRKARRVKEGYVPQEEVPLYESKGKQFKAKSDQVVLTTGETVKRIIPGLYIMDDNNTEKKEKTKKKSKSKADDMNKKMESMTLSEAPKPEAKQNQETSDPAKKLKNLKKRLREVEALEEKLKSGAIAKPEPDQLKKVQRKSELILQIDELEKQIG